MERQALLMGLGLIALGVSGWVLPYKWNLLRLKRRYAGAVSETANKRVPKVVGTLLIIFGGVLLASVFMMRGPGIAG
jgi:hypothetical protein